MRLIEKYEDKKLDILMRHGETDVAVNMCQEIDMRFLDKLYEWLYAGLAGKESLRVIPR